MELTEMKNIGAAMKQKLNAIGIHDADELSAMGSKEAFARIKATYPNVCLVHLYTLQAAIDDTDFDLLPEDVKQELKAFSDSLK